MSCSDRKYVNGNSFYKTFSYIKMTVSEHRLGEHKLPTVGALRHLVKFSDFLSRLLLLSIKNSWQHLSSPSAMQACLAGVHSNLDTPALPTECEISKVNESQKFNWGHAQPLSLNRQFGNVVMLMWRSLFFNFIKTSAHHFLISPQQFFI